MEDKEIIIKLKNCKTVKELKALGKEIGYELTDEEAEHYFEKISKSGELSDDELNSVSGGGCTKWRNGRAYSGIPPHQLIITKYNSCIYWKLDRDSKGMNRSVCFTCYHRGSSSDSSRWCQKRSYYRDPLNPPKK